MKCFCEYLFYKIYTFTLFMLWQLCVLSIKLTKRSNSIFFCKILLKICKLYMSKLIRMGTFNLFWFWILVLLKCIWYPYGRPRLTHYGQIYQILEIADHTVRMSFLHGIFPEEADGSPPLSFLPDRI